MTKETLYKECRCKGQHVWYDTETGRWYCVRCGADRDSDATKEGH